MTYKWFVDLSHHNGVFTDAQMSELVSNGCVGFSIKAGQGINYVDEMCDDHIANAKRFGIPYTIFHWADPILDPIKQARFAIDLAKQFGAQGITPDVEQWWMNWQEWYNVLVLHLPGTVRAYNADYLLRFYSEYLKELNRLNHQETKLPIMAYSAQWFFHGYCRALATVVRDSCDDYWNACYVTWKQLDQDPKLSWDEFHATLDNLVIPANRMPNGITKWSAWQFGIAKMKGWAELDCDIITDEAAARYFGTEPIVIPPPPPPAPPPTPTTLQMEVIVDTLNIRDKPSKSEGADIGDLHMGDIVNVLDIDGTAAWIEFEPGKYACVKGIKDRYMKRHIPEEERTGGLSYNTENEVM
jgi:hypothetical protein